MPKGTTQPKKTAAVCTPPEETSCRLSRYVTFGRKSNHIGRPATIIGGRPCTSVPCGVSDSLSLPGAIISARCRGCGKPARAFPAETRVHNLDARHEGSLRHHRAGKW